MKSRLTSPPASSSRATASSRAASVPGQVGSQTSAMEAVLDRRGSMTAIPAPDFLPSIIRWACGLK